MYKFNNVLLTGASGLLGSWVVEELIKNNKEVVGVALDDTKDDLLKYKNIFKNLNLMYIDIAKEDQVDNLFSKNNFDIVIHLAAQTQVIDADLNPRKTFDSNIKGTWNILENCRTHDIPVVVASSDKAYGVSSNLPYFEDHPLNGIFPYEVSKSITDMLVKSYYFSYDLRVTSLRCGNIYGGGDFNWDRLIPGLCKWFIGNEQPILRTDGSFKRDWVYVEDVAKAYLGVADKLFSDSDKVSMFYNFAAEDYKSVIEVYETVSKLIKGEVVEPIYNIDSSKEIPDQYLDSTKIKKELNISSSIDLMSGLSKTVDWYKDYFLNFER